MQDDLIWSGNAFFASARDHMYEKTGKKSANDLAAPNKPVAPDKPIVSDKPAAPNKPEFPTKPEFVNKPEMPGKLKVKQDDTFRALGDDDECGYRTGDLPPCAPLAVSYVPVQRSVDPIYGADDTLTRGTLFPGLDLPFMNIANAGNPYAGTPLGELMAIGLVVHELTLYLDTHPHDKEAFTLQKKMLKLKQEAHARYTKLYGPISVDDLLESESFTWTHGPWPWETPAPGTTRSTVY